MTNEVTRTAPKKIWLCVTDEESDCDRPYPEITPDDECVTWSTDMPVACTVGYVREDLCDGPSSETAYWRFRAEREEILTKQLRAEIDALLALLLRCNGRLEWLEPSKPTMLMTDIQTALSRDGK